MGDLISRQVVIETLCNHYEVNNAVQNATIDECIMLVKNILSAEPLTEEDYTELRDRFGEYVEFVVRDMITGKGERWK